MPRDRIACLVAAVKSGDDAHGPAQRIPGARDVVLEHEEWGERTRDVFLAVATLEIITLLLMKRPGAARVFRRGSAAIGPVGAFLLYQAAEQGGDVVYAYAGGVGTRSGQPEDVQRLLIAGLHHMSNLAQGAGNKEEAARLIEEMARQRPNDVEIQLTYAATLLSDRGDPNAGMGRLNAIRVPRGNQMLEVRHGMIMADVYEALSQPDSARLYLEALSQRYPQAGRLRTRLDRMRGGSGGS